MNADVECIDTPALSARQAIVTWDTIALGAPAGQITRLEVRAAGAEAAFAQHLAWRAAHGVRMVSCRLPHDRLRESMLLETHGYRFIEMVHHPYLASLTGFDDDGDTLRVLPATAADYEPVRGMAERAFTHERFASDPRLSPAVSSRRYGNWVDNTRGHATQRLIKFDDDGMVVGFFIIEFDTDGTCYWHLTAIAPDFQGQGYGWRAWRKAIAYATAHGASRVATTIAARNVPVMNLYVRLGFRFAAPSMTFHWLA